MFRRDIAHRCPTFARGRVRTAGHLADLFFADVNQITSFSHPSRRQIKPHKVSPDAVLGDLYEGLLAIEITLSEFHGETNARFKRICRVIMIVADQKITGLLTQASSAA